jgi:isopentenyl-diphosphate delta-isomerase
MRLSPIESADEHVVLVDEQDQETGVMEKMEAHRRGELHRAFSVFLFDASGRVLLQQRASTKYHSAMLWTNACCSHPRPGETIARAARRRVKEELGVDSEPRPQFHFRYRAAFGNGLFENELDHVLFAEVNDLVQPDTNEVAAVRWVEMDELTAELDQRPEHFTVWLRECWPLVIELRRSARERN